MVVDGVIKNIINDNMKNKTKIKNFESYKLYESIESDKEYLLSLGFIGIYTSNYNNGKLKVKNVEPETYKKDLTTSRTMTPLSYSSIMRLFLFTWFYKYDGNNEDIIKIKTELDAPGENYTKRILNQFARNRTILSKFIGRIIGSYSTFTTDFSVMIKFINKSQEIFTENNILKYFRTISEITNIAEKSEKAIIDMINNNSIVKLKNAQKVSGAIDIGGVDVIAYTNAGHQVTIQVKRLSKTTDLYKSERGHYRTMTIKDTDIDLNIFDAKTDGELSYDYLYIIDEKQKTLHVINTKAIIRIMRYEKNRSKSKTKSEQLKLQLEAKYIKKNKRDDILITFTPNKDKYRIYVKEMKINF